MSDLSLLYHTHYSSTASNVYARENEQLHGMSFVWQIALKHIARYDSCIMSDSSVIYYTTLM